MTSLVPRQFLVFLLTGGTAAAINFGSRILYNNWMNFSSAILFAYLTGMIAAFFLTKLFVFKQSKQSVKRSVFYFILVNIIAACQTWSISITLANYVLPFIGLRFFIQEISHGTGLIIPVFTIYIGHKHFSFK